MRRADSFEKSLMLGKIEGKRTKGAAEDEMIRQYHLFNGHEQEKTLGDSEGRGAWCATVHGVTKNMNQLSEKIITLKHKIKFKINALTLNPKRKVTQEK